MQSIKLWRQVWGTSRRNFDIKRHRRIDLVLDYLKLGSKSIWCPWPWIQIKVKVLRVQNCSKKIAKYIPNMAAIFILKGRKNKILCPYRSRFCGCIRNSEKTAPKDPQILLKTCEGSKTMKETRYRYEKHYWNHRSRFVYLRKNFKCLAQLHYTVYSSKSKYICFCSCKNLRTRKRIQNEIGWAVKSESAQIPAAGSHTAARIYSTLRWLTALLLHTNIPA